FRDSARAFLRAQAPLARLRKLRDTPPGFERAMWKRIADAGWTGILAGESDGGLGLGLGAACAIAEEVGRNPLSEPFIAGAVLNAAALQALPSSDLKTKLTAKLITGEALIGLAWQEQSGQIDPLPIAATAAPSGSKIKIAGRKRWVTPGTGA